MREMVRAQWAESIIARQAEQGVPIARAVTFIERLRTWAQPIVVICDDGNTYIAKCVQADRPEVTARAMTADHVTARMAIQLAAPVPAVGFVELPAELIAAEDHLHDMVPGLAHALRWLPDHSGRQRLAPPDTAQQRDAYGRLSVLYGWLHADDPQLISSNDAERRVCSVDHGGFLPNGPNWSCDSLLHRESLPPAPYARLANGGDPISILDSSERLSNVTDTEIALTVGWVRSEWGIPLDDLLELVAFLIRRRDAFDAGP